MQADDHQWRLILPLFSLVVIAILLIFRHTFLGMAGIWARSDTYAHGFVVLPITLWLIWRKRSEVARLTPRPSYSAWLLLAGVGFSWLLGDLAAVNSLTQFAAVGMLVLAVPAVLGWPVARALAFSLLFLFFSVPLVVRLEGTNVEQGKAILRDSGLNVVSAADMADGAKQIVALSGAAKA
jgi:exosortase